MWLSTEIGKLYAIQNFDDECVMLCQMWWIKNIFKQFLLRSPYRFIVNSEICVLIAKVSSVVSIWSFSLNFPSNVIFFQNLIWISFIVFACLTHKFTMECFNFCVYKNLFIHCTFNFFLLSIVFPSGNKISRNNWCFLRKF